MVLQDLIIHNGVPRLVSQAVLAPLASQAVALGMDFYLLLYHKRDKEKGLPVGFIFWPVLTEIRKK